MSCERFAVALTDHAAGADLPPAVRAHLVDCAPCQEFLAGEQRLVSEMDGNLTAMFAVEPSVEFAARVRQRVDVERDGPQTFAVWRWVLGGASVAAAAVALAFALNGGGAATRSADAPKDAKGATPDVKVAPPDASVEVPRPAPAAERVPRVAVRAAPVRTAAPAAPEVLVPSDRRLAIARLLAMSRDGRLDQGVMPADPAAAPQNLESPPVLPLVVDGLKLTPIAVDGGQLPGGGSDSRPRPQAAERAGLSRAAN